MRPSHDSVFVGESGSDGDADFNSMVTLFRKMQKYSNFTSDLEPLTDMNNVKKLRDLVKNEAYILAITAEKNRRLNDELRKTTN